MAADVREGLVSRERAASVYGVVIGEDGSVDEAATAARRGGTAERADMAGGERPTITR